MSEETQLRDQLAVERTRLANERTLLAYIRTAAALAAGGAILPQFLPGIPFMHIVAWVLISTGILMLMFGAYRFWVVSRKLALRRSRGAD